MLSKLSLGVKWTGPNSVDKIGIIDINKILKVEKTFEWLVTCLSFMYTVLFLLILLLVKQVLMFYHLKTWCFVS